MLNKKSLIVLLPFCSAILLWFSYHPANISFLAWIAFVPLLIFIIAKSEEPGFFKKRFPFVTKPGFRYLLAVYLGGVLFYLAGLYWISYVTFAGVFIIPLFLSLYWVAFSIISYFALRHLPAFAAAIGIPCVWVFLEYLRSFVLTGFPWFMAGHTQYQWLNLIQIADLTGVYGISFLILLVNSVIALVVKDRFKLSLRHISLIIIAGILLGVSVMYSKWRLDHLPTRPGPNIGIVQGNIPQTLKIAAREDEDLSEENFRKHLLLSYGLLRQKTHPDLIVWAETMFPALVWENRKASLESVTDIALYLEKPMLVGVLVSVPDDNTELKYVTRDNKTELFNMKLFNSAYYVNPHGEILGRYDKTHLVPVSEYIPLRRIFPFIDTLIMTFSQLPYIAELSPGENLNPFVLPVTDTATGKVKDYKYGVQICYEAIFPELTRFSAQRGADFIINISNDGWFKHSSELDQILAISAFRAVENKLGFVRVTNTGVSAMIQPSGKITELKNEKGLSKEVEGNWVEPVTIAQQTGSFYTKAGDFFPNACILFFLLLIILKLFKILDK